MALFFEIDEARKILGLEEAASKNEIEAAFQRMSLRYHPDQQKPADKPEAERRMKDINWAYELLQDYWSHSECKYCFTERAVEQAYPRDAHNWRWAAFMTDSNYI